MLERGLSATEDILAWIDQRNKNIAVLIRKNALSDSDFWFYDEKRGTIHNRNDSFFSVVGFQKALTDGALLSQPILLQPEIGYLGIICKEFDGVMHFLMQAKIEPGNVNNIQLSPTIQATKSNFTQKHGGAKPPYLEYFVNAAQHEIVVDQIQSEQSSRFYKKRNRNIVVRVEEDIPVLPSHCWMTLGQIKLLMRQDNLVNMDTRTVLSCIPFYRLRLSPLVMSELSDRFVDKPLFRSVFIGDADDRLPQVYQHINNCKMFAASQEKLLPLYELPDWEWRAEEFVCKHPYPFKVIFCDIAIEGREVRHWTQPLFEACGMATFGLLCCEENGVLKFLVRSAMEGGCFDTVELGPTVQREAAATHAPEDAVTALFDARLRSGIGVFFDRLLSEEGGRFYHEQNRNVLIRVRREELPPLPEGYFLLDYRTLNELVQFNNTLNIQLRNLLSLLEA